MNTRIVPELTAAVATRRRRRMRGSVFMTTLAMFSLSIHRPLHVYAATTTTKARRVNITAANFAFSPTTITLKKGQKVTFALKNTDTVKHNLTITALKVNKNVSAGKTGQVTMTLKAAGTYEFHCEYHPQQMKGTIAVS
jgi:plastocyanin